MPPYAAAGTDYVGVLMTSSGAGKLAGFNRIGPGVYYGGNDATFSYRIAEEGIALELSLRDENRLPVACATLARA